MQVMEWNFKWDVMESVRGTGQQNLQTKADMSVDKRGANTVTYSYCGMERTVLAAKHILEQDQDKAV